MHRSYVALVAALVVLLAGLLYLLVRTERKPRTTPGPPEVSAPGADVLPPTRTAVLFFGSDDGEGLYRELREVRAAEGIGEEARVLLEELIRGPEGNGLPVLPEGTSLRRAYFDEQSQCLYLDFSRELKTRHWGGSAAELLTVRALLATVGTNLPAAKMVQILIDGKEVESIAGHISARRPFVVSSWVEMGGEDEEGMGE